VHKVTVERVLPLDGVVTGVLYVQRSLDADRFAHRHVPVALGGTDPGPAGRWSVIRTAAGPYV
jgi:hypothetical protein